MRSWVERIWILSLLAGCWTPAPESTDAGSPPDSGFRGPDGGTTRADAGSGFMDAGGSFHFSSPTLAGEPCPEDAVVDGGSADFTMGLCVALSSVAGLATHNGQPVDGGIELIFRGTNFQSEISHPVDGEGRYEVSVLRGRYENLLFHPDGIHPQHQGPKDFGPIDLRQNQVRDLAVRTWVLSGTVAWGGVPWATSFQPPDIQLSAFSDSLYQSVQTSNVGGNYQLPLLEGTLSLALSVPKEALGETALVSFPIGPALLDHRQDRTLDLAVNTSELAGTVTLDGNPLPDRVGGPDFELHFTLPGTRRTVARSYHSGGVATFKAAIPRGTYGVELELAEFPDPALPALLFNKQLSAPLDLSLPSTRNFQLRTYQLEGMVQLDGVPLPSNPGARWYLYAYAYASAAEPSFLAYYEVPLTSASFFLRAFPASYYLSVYVSAQLEPDLAEGWYGLSNHFAVVTDTALPIDIRTSPVQGTLRVDGALASAAGRVATLHFHSPFAQFSKQVFSSDGTFFVRVPKGYYDVSVELDPVAFPGYAIGLQRLAAGVDLTTGQTLALDYQTRSVQGPLRLEGNELPDSLGIDPEAAVLLQRPVDGALFRYPLQGGQGGYALRIPPGVYQLSFELLPGAFSGVAAGSAPMGLDLRLP